MCTHAHYSSSTDSTLFLEISSMSAANIVKHQRKFFNRLGSKGLHGVALVKMNAEDDI